MGMPSREEGAFNAWLVFDTPSRRLAVMAKLIAPQVPQELLFGYPAPSKYRKSSHCFFPIVAVDGSSPRRRVGWVWPCCHSTLTAPESESADCIRGIAARPRSMPAQQNHQHDHDDAEEDDPVEQAQGHREAY
jgi:hypothetical protein